jgi:hypothetical protein
MLLLSMLSQIAVSLSIFIVWIFRFQNVEREFKQFQLNDVTRNMVGVVKTSLSTMLILGIWYPDLIFPSALILAFFMMCAQYFHYSVSNSWKKHLPSLTLLGLCFLIIFSKI